jgi:uncharacterized OB-fold protein
MTAVSATTGFPRQLPAIEKDSGFYWEAGERGGLLIQRCVCGRYQHPPLPRCLDCGGVLAPEPVSGRARVATFTVNHQPWRRGLAVPYVFAVVELEEQAELYVMTNIVDCTPEAVSIGLPVEVQFECHEDVWLPMFRPRGTD